MMRNVAWTLTALVAFAVVAYLALLLVNWSDESPSADSERLVALHRDRPLLADAANGYVHLLGLAAEADADPVALGSVRNAHIEAYVPASLGDVMSGLPGKDVDYRAVRSPEVTALVDACADASACSDAVDAHPDALAQWLASEQWLLDRYRRMLATDGWREPIPGHVTTPLAGYQHAMEAQKLHLLAVRQQALARDPVAVRDLLDRELLFWRQVLASSDLLISRMVAVAAVNRHFAFGNLALRELPPDLADAAVPPSWRQPLTVAERSLMRSLAGEWHYISGTLQAAILAQGGPADAGWRVSQRLQQPLLQQQATLNLFAGRMVRMGTLSELPYPEIGPALQRVAQPQEAPPLRLRTYNMLGHLLHDVGPASAYADYIAPSADLEGHRRAALLVATLRGAGIRSEDMAAAVRDAPLRSPYDDAAFEWDAAGGAVVFRGLGKADRRRHVVLF